jgi:hypothetical protein
MKGICLFHFPAGIINIRQETDSSGKYVTTGLIHYRKFCREIRGPDILLAFCSFPEFRESRGISLRPSAELLKKDPAPRIVNPHGPESGPFIYHPS